jgi:hypothetical protein
MSAGRRDQTDDRSNSNTVPGSFRSTLIRLHDSPEEALFGYPYRCGPVAGFLVIVPERSGVQGI